ncbi:MAG: GTPase HflX [Thermodesulfobacteriota bacterium]
MGRDKSVAPFTSWPKARGPFLSIYICLCYNTYHIINTICPGGIPIPQLQGNLTGLKPGQIKRLKNIYKRRVPPDMLVTPELMRYMTELSAEISRQIGIIINRAGLIVYAIVGDEREILIPALSEYPLGRKHLRGVRLVHTHLKDEPLSMDDLTDLALLRLDYIAAVGVDSRGLPAHIHSAHLLPYNPEEELYQVEKPLLFQNFHIEMDAFVRALEEQMGRTVLIDVKDSRVRAILVSVATKVSREDMEESLGELGELAATGGVNVLHSVTQRPARLNPKFLMGKGRIKSLIIEALQRRADLLIFDQDLTPTQVRELGEVTELKVIDRTQLILDIFARRAHSRDGKVQVELAQLKYLLPRLTGKGTALSRLMGGIGGRGPGETRLEMDRRKVQKRIHHLESSLKALSRGRDARRKRRARSNIPIISIAGYTNAGKSTLLNTLTKSSALAEDKLFATLDTMTRRLRFPYERDAVITDTVGFIRDLPEDLMKAFRATLEEMEDADLIIHLVDVSSPLFAKRMDTVERIFTEIGIDEIPRLLVFNKTDLLEERTLKALLRRYNAIGISAEDPETLTGLLRALESRLWPMEDYAYESGEGDAGDEQED